MLKKSKRNALKEKSVLTTNVTIGEKAKKGSKSIINVTPPKILPKCDIIPKKSKYLHIHIMYIICIFHLNECKMEVFDDQLPYSVNILLVLLLVHNSYY